MPKLQPKIVDKGWNTLDHMENEMLPYENDAMLIHISNLKLILSDTSRVLEQKQKSKEQK